MSKQCSKCKSNQARRGLAVCVDCFRYITRDCPRVRYGRDGIVQSVEYNYALRSSDQ